MIMKMIKYLIFSFLILSSVSLRPTQACLRTPKIHIHILNDLPQGTPPLQIHCSSNQGDDMGSSSYGAAQMLSHDFCDTEFPRETIYNCHFSWNGKAKDFRIYRPFFDYHFGGNTVYFAVRADGFYFADSYPASHLEKKLDW